MKRFLTLIACVATALMAVVACDDPTKGGGVSLGEGTITYNTSAESISAAFFQSDEDMTMLYFSLDKVGFTALETSRYYVKISLDTADVDGRTLDPAKGEVSVELFDVENENELKAVGGEVSVKGSARSALYKVELSVALDDEQSVLAVSFSGGCVNGGSIAYANEWTYLHPTSGVISSIIWEAFLDKRNADVWYLYLAPVKDVLFEEVTYFSPVKITLPANVALDGERVPFAGNSALSVAYGPNEWSAENAPNGFVKVLYDETRKQLTIRFATDGGLKGYYSGAVDVVEGL